MLIILLICGTLILGPIIYTVIGKLFYNWFMKGEDK